MNYLVIEERERESEKFKNHFTKFEFITEYDMNSLWNINHTSYYIQESSKVLK